MVSTNIETNYTRSKCLMQTVYEPDN